MKNKKYILTGAKKTVLPLTVLVMALSAGCGNTAKAGAPVKSEAAVTESETVVFEETIAFRKKTAVGGGEAVTVPYLPSAEPETQVHIEPETDEAVVQIQSVKKQGPGQNSGVIITRKEIEIRGLSSFFTSGNISDSLYKRIYGKSYKEDCTVPRSELRYLKVLHYGPDGNIYTGELICHQDISESLLEIFKELYNHQYPIEKIGLVDDYGADDLASAADNNSSCFNFRESAGTGNSLSRHAYGKAIDINPLYNPYVWTDESGLLRCDPENGRAYINREADYPYKIDENDLCYQLFIKHGFSWGGSWEKEKDYMHFSIQ